MTKNNQKITEDWNIKKLGEMGKFVSGGTPDTEKPEYWNGDIIWLTPSEITKLPTRFVSDSERKITRAGLKNSSAVLLPVGSLIICTRATVGDCCINIKEVSTNQGFKNLIPENSNIDFLYYLISSHKTDLIRKACGSTFLEISKHDIEKLKYSVPPLSEQEKIAKILGCWDDGIEKLSRLIEQKKLLKKGLMQRLLTGKQRLPGFSDPWKKVKLGELFSKSLLKNKEAKTLPILTNSATQGIILQDEYFDREIVTKENISNYYCVENGDFIYNPRISKKAPAGPIKRNHFQEKGCISPLYTIFKINQENYASFYEMYFESNLWVYEAYKVANYGVRSDRMNITDEDFFDIKLPYPPLSEQKAIADILSKADEEIDLLTRKLDLLQSQKKGLMQQLLTGKIRVKVA